MNGAVYVLGMHRSGTSAVTRLVNLMGIAAPRADDLVPPGPKNPTGYWESMSLVAFNTRVLAAVGSDMRCPLLLTSGWESDRRLDALRLEAVEAVHATFPSAPWVWKDPRNCLAFAFWRSTIDVAPAIILVHRNPLEIAASTMRRRSDETKIYALALWERYLRQALEQVGGLPVRVSDYQSVLADPVGWVEDTRAFLERAGVEVRRALDESVRDFVDPSLKHASFAVDEFLEDCEVSDAQRVLFLALNDLIGDHDAFPAPVLSRETPTTEALLAERRRGLELVHAVKQELTGSPRWARLKPLLRLRVAPAE
jgi:hypothetical protein